MEMGYCFFKMVTPWLKEEDYNLYKDYIEKLVSSIGFLPKVKDALKIILQDETLNNKEKWINKLINIKNDELMVESLIDILKISYIRENDFYVSSVMREYDILKRRNLINALQNLKIYGNSKWYYFIREQADEMLQRRIIFILQYEVGIQMFKKIPLKHLSEEELEKELINIELTIFNCEKVRHDYAINKYANNKTDKNLVFLMQTENEFKTLFNHFNSVNSAIESQEKNGENLSKDKQLEKNIYKN